MWFVEKVLKDRYVLRRRCAGARAGVRHGHRVMPLAFTEVTPFLIVYRTIPLDLRGSALFDDAETIDVDDSVVSVSPRAGA